MSCLVGVSLCELRLHLDNAGMVWRSDSCWGRGRRGTSAGATNRDAVRIQQLVNTDRLASRASIGRGMQIELGFRFWDFDGLAGAWRNYPKQSSIYYSYPWFADSPAELKYVACFVRVCGRWCYKGMHEFTTVGLFRKRPQSSQTGNRDEPFLESKVRSVVLSLAYDSFKRTRAVTRRGE